MQRFTQNGALRLFNTSILILHWSEIIWCWAIYQVHERNKVTEEELADKEEPGNCEIMKKEIKGQ